MPSLYVLNTPILTEYGQYHFKKISFTEMMLTLSSGEFISAIGHEATAKLMSELTGMEIPTNRISIKMQPGDQAVVFRVLTRLPEGKVLTQEEIENLPYEFSLLEMVE